MRRWLLLISTIALFFLVSGSVLVQAQETGQVTGRLQTKSGKPMSGGLVYFFTVKGPLPDPDRYWRIPDFLVEIKDKGKFSIELPEGEYYFGAIKRARGKTENGPPQAGDFFYKALDDKGAPTLYSVTKGEKKDLGTIAGVMPYKGLKVGDSITAIEGRVITADGKPVKGALVFAFISEAMIGKPTFASYRTGKDGKYVLRVNQGGSFFLRVRDIYGGGPPIPGAIIGTFGGETPETVSVKTGDRVKGIDITVAKFKGRGQPR